MLIKPFKFVFAIIIIALNFCACNKTETTSVDTPVDTIVDTTYTLYGSQLLNLAQPKQVIGANAFHSFGVGSTDMNAWNIDIAREFICNVKEEPLTNTAIKDSNVLTYMVYNA